MREAKNAASATVPSASVGKYYKPTTAKEIKRSQATHRLVVRLTVCLAAIAGIYTVQVTGDMSTRLALSLGAAVLTAGAFFTGRWCQFMWAKEG